MDWLEGRQTLTGFLKKYRMAMIVLGVGLVLMWLPDRESTQAQQEHYSPMQEAAVSDLEQELEALLSHLEGAGKVRVLLTESRGSEVIYQNDRTESQSSDTGNFRTETVLVTDRERNQTGLIRRTDPPGYMGAVVLCQGADSASVRLAVVDAVKTATGLGSDKIAVWKMK